MLSFILHGLRSWKSAKGVAVLAICALALGIGSATAIYSVIQAVLLNPLGYAQQDRFLSVWSGFSFRPTWHSAFSYLIATDFAARNRTLDSFGCLGTASFNLTYNNQTTHVRGAVVMPALVNSLGVQPVLGRWFNDRPGHNDGFFVAVLSHALWNRLGADPAIAGKSLSMNGRPYNILGVAPPWFRLPIDDSHNDVWVPLNPSEPNRKERGYNDLACIAKMKPGVTREQVTSDLSRVTRELAHEYPKEFLADRIIANSTLEDAVLGVRATLLLLLGAAAALLLIACSNVAGLLLARSVTRARETAVRVALGAARGQLALQYFAEGLLVSVAGAAFGAVLSFAIIRAVLTIAAEDIPRAEDITIDWRVLAFALALAVICGILFSLAPLWQAQRTPPNEVLSDGTRASAGARSRGLLRLFVVSEIALAFGLLSVGALLVSHLGALRKVNPGFDPNHLLTMRVYAPSTKYPTDESKAAYETRLMQAIERLPGVESAGFTNLMPMDGWGNNTFLSVDGRPPVPLSQSEPIEYRTITPGYFRAMGIPLIEGRVPGAEGGKPDGSGVLPLVINQKASKFFWPSGHALGAYVHLHDEGNQRLRIVGIVGDARNAGLGWEVRPELYISYVHSPPNVMTWAVRSHLDTASLAQELRAGVSGVDAGQAVYRVTPMQEMIENSLTQERLESFMVSFFAVAALLLAMLGIYGVVSYSVRQRTTEIGTRMAIGATTGNLMRLVIGDGLKMAGIGVGAGLVVVLALAHFLSESDLHLHIDDVRPFLFSTGMVILLTSLACFFPAWRATLVSPMIAIRNEPGVMWQRTRWGILRVAEQFSGLLTRADVQAASSESDLLAEIADVSRRAGSFSDAIRAALECLRQRIGAESLALFVQREQGQPYRCHGVVPDSCVDTWTLPAGALIVSRLRSFAGPLPFERGELDATATWAAENAPAHLPEVALLREMGAAIAIRVAVKKEISGILFAGKPVGRAVYNSLEKRLLRGVCAQFAMMIENSRLTDRIVEQERLRRELLLAGEVQKRLFPERSPETANLQLAGVCIPARGVGGDYYDFIDLGNRNLGIALADVAGKGIAAALVMSVVQASLRSLAGNDGVSLAELASKMNRLLYRSTGTNSYATFFYGEVDEEHRELRYVNAGHNPPYLLRNGHLHTPVPFVASTAPIEELTTGGTIIGMFAQSSYEEGLVHLHPGDLLIAFTDGVPEALDPKEEEFGEDRLKEILRAVSHLPVNDMAARIVGELKKWISDAAQYDDMTFILMKVN